MPVTKATHQGTKQHNRDLVLRILFNRETISRAEIARQTQLTRTTVSEVVTGLLSEGLVTEVGAGSSIGGKPSIQLRLVPGARHLIGLNLAQNKFIGSVIDLRGEIKKTVEVPVRGTDGKHALRLVYRVLDQLVSAEWQPLVGIGVGTPGLVNTRAGVVVNAVNLDWEDLALAQLLEEQYHLPVRILNDSQATAIGEFVYGGHALDGNLIVVNVSHGVGAGILINGQLFQGDGGGAGEIGHVRTETGEAGQLCRCGRRGCLESRAGGWAILQAVQRLPGRSNLTTLDELETDLTDPAIREIVSDAGHHLGTALGSLIGALHIHKLVLTGDVTRFRGPWLEAVQKAMSGAALGRMTQETQLEIGNLGYRACLLGSAAYLLLNDYSLLFQQEN